MELYHEQPINQINAVKSRSYYIPFDNISFSLDKEKSNRVKLLTSFKFAFFKDFDEMVFSISPKEDTNVPFNWQIKGYDYNQYANYNYPFPFDFPTIDKENPCGVYETSFEVKDLNCKRYIVFDGVDSCLYLLVNNKFVGYSTVSHSQAEFDITDYLVLGNNSIKIVVLKWCTGSYFEDQDKLRLSGIFRDVYILERPNDHITDYKITTDIVDKDGIISILCDKNIEVSLYDNQILLDKITGNNISFRIHNAKLWNSETPNVYRLVIYYNGEYIQEFVGIRTVKIDNSIFLLNDKPIKLRGVNRHCFTDNGYVETIDDMIKDINMMKANNINAIRTSHYPPHPIFPILCELNGIYLILEADLETHGLETIQGEGSMNHANDLANNESIEHIYVHRIERAYQRDKNRQSVIIWSMGNESGWGKNFIKSYKFLKQLDNRPIHYEGNYLRGDCSHKFLDCKYDDFYSLMYPEVNVCIYQYNLYTDKPFILCEYTHAMGNSCGDVKEYWDFINKEDRFLGAFVWEWCNQTIKIDNDKYIFGGDFNEKQTINHYEGNFCVDGLVDTDRKEHPSLHEIKQVYAPIDVINNNDNSYDIINLNSFVTLDDVSCKVIIEENGKEIESYFIDIKGINPKESKKVFVDKKANFFTTVNFEFYKDDNQIAKRQFVISNNYPITLDGKKINVNSNIINTDNYQVSINKKGMIEKLIIDNKNILNKAVNFDLYRDPIDNDYELAEMWNKFNIKLADSYIYKKEYIDNKMILHGKIVVDYLEPLYEFVMKYQFFDNKIRVSIDATKNDFINNVARFGLAFNLVSSFDKCKYFGRGKEENYIDRINSTYISEYKDNVKTMNFDYQKTQSNGNHTDTLMLLMSSDNQSIKFESNSFFNFTVTPYELCDVKRHNYEMDNSTNKTIVHIDYKVAGVGSAACGAPLASKYLVNDKKISYSFDITIK